jgi:hypothetical protein
MKRPQPLDMYAQARNGHQPTYTVAELFCGCGGFSHWFKRSGRFRVVLGNDIKRQALATFALNHTENATPPAVIAEDIALRPGRPPRKVPCPGNRILALRVALVDTPPMTQMEFSRMMPAARAKWLNRVSPTSKWKFGDDVFCLHCDGLFKAEDVACDDEGDPTCPLCHSSTPLDFHHLPWWREDLCKELDAEVETDEQHAWKVEPIHATPGQPRTIPRPNPDEKHHAE